MNTSKRGWKIGVVALAAAALALTSGCSGNDGASVADLERALQEVQDQLDELRAGADGAGADDDANGSAQLDAGDGTFAFIRDEVVDGCLTSTPGQDDYCNCIADWFIAEFSLTDLMRMTDEEIVDATIDGGFGCLHHLDLRAALEATADHQDYLDIVGRPATGDALQLVGTWAWTVDSAWQYTFAADGTGTRPGMTADPIDFTWGVEGDLLVIAVTVFGIESDELWSWEIEDGTLTITSRQVHGLSHSYNWVDTRV